MMGTVLQAQLYTFYYKKALSDLKTNQTKLIMMEEGQFGSRKRKILKMMALKRKKLKRRYAGRGDHNERLPHLPKFLKKIGCNIMSSSWTDKAGRKGVWSQHVKER